MKICLIGAGSFVFGPTVLHDAILDHRIDGLEFALVDPRIEMADYMAGMGRQMAKAAGIVVQFTTHRAWKDALDGADFVICCAAVELQRRFEMDVQIIREHYPAHLITEFGGVHGIAGSLRQIAMIRRIASDMRELCPNARLLCSSNPLPRVCQAAHELGIRTAGFCSNSLGGYFLFGRVLDGTSESYPWPQASAGYKAVMAGVNHFTFTLELRNQATGRDILLDFIQRARQQHAFEPRTAELVEQTGFYPANGDGHMRDFIAPKPGTPDLEMASHGTAEEREARMATLRAAADGSGPWEPLLAHRAWERPIDFAAALTGGRKAEFHSLNLVNSGQLPDLPNGVFVETPVTADASGPKPLPLRLPEAVANLSRSTAEITNLIVRAALDRRHDLLDEVIERDPTICDKAAGKIALEACLKAHSDLLEE